MPALLLPLVNPFWFETMSHKILRLLGPWLLVGLAATSVASLAAGSSIGGVLAAAQAAFYAAAALGPAAGRLGGVARTFVVLNLAAVVGLWRHVSGRQRITW